jgi:hypothetical protein
MVEEVSEIYIQLFEDITGEKFRWKNERRWAF